MLKNAQYAFSIWLKQPTEKKKKFINEIKREVQADKILKMSSIFPHYNNLSGDERAHFYLYLINYLSNDAEGKTLLNSIKKCGAFRT